MRIIVGITGASGSIYGVRLLELLRERSVETELIVTEQGERTLELETSWRVPDVRALASRCYGIDELDAPPASGSYPFDGMVIAPCSMKTLSALAHSLSLNLLLRSGDVALKERRPLIVLVRESPLHLGHLKNMCRLAMMGAIIMPPIPAFYNRPSSIEELVDETLSRVLNLLKLPGIPGKGWKES